MNRPLFDAYLVVDWSAAAQPATGPDSIWWTLIGRDGRRLGANPPTRAAAMAEIAALLRAEAAAGRRVLAGFDFPFGYPAGVAERLCGRPGWAPLWEMLGEALPETPDNANDRYALAARLNAAWPGQGPFWGNGAKAEHPGLPRTKPAGYGERLPPEWRVVETRQRALKGAKPKSVWQLAGAGSVGGQALTGIAALERLRRALGEAAEVWPFETGLAPPRRAICIAEVYPSLVPLEARAGEVKDAAQVRLLAERFALLDTQGALAPLFEARGLEGPERAAAEAEEAWILGAGEPALARLPAPRLRYERDPARIYAESFATVRAEAPLDHLPEDLRDVAVRLVHACGMTDVPARLAWSDDVAASARAALGRGAPVLCDCRMVASGVIASRLPEGVRVACTLNDVAVPERARAIGNTRSAAAVELWEERIAGAVVAIGNAPTALFHLLELLDAGWPRPAAILAFPVGFVGAAESKAALAADPRGVPFLTLRGRRGGSAMAAAAVNALAGGLA